MHKHIERIARAAGIIAQETRRARLVDGMLQMVGFLAELTANINIRRHRADGETADQATFDELMRVVAHHVAVFAGAGLALIRIHHEVARAAIGCFRHERPFHARAEARPAAPAQAGGFHFLNDFLTPQRQQRAGIVPVAAFLGAFQRPIMMAVEIGENAVLIG